MKHLMKHRPSPALVIACLALFVSLGGVSYGVATGFIDSREIRNNTIRTQDLRNNDVRGRDIRNSTIRTRDVGFNALTGSDINESRLGAVPSATQATNAGTLGGIGPNGFLRPDTTGYVPITDFDSGTTTIPGEAPPAYDIDPLGYVHLRGSLTSPTGIGAKLPPEARPATNSYFAVANPSFQLRVVDIDTDGEIGPSASGPISLDGITFKAAG